MFSEHQSGMAANILDDRVEIEFNFIETELSFRDAFLQTIEHIRNKTDKELVLCLSGGADSQLVKWGFDYLGIKIRSRHLRYLWNGCYINWQEGRYLPDDTEFVDIDVHEFQKSELFQDRFVKEFPQNVHSALQCDMRCNPETDYLVTGGYPVSIYKFDFREDKRWVFNAANAWKTIGFREYENTGTFLNNGYITYALHDDLHKKLAREMEGTGKWDGECKHHFYKHHFPELDERLIPKKIFVHTSCPYFKSLIIDRLQARYQYEIDGVYYEYDCYPQRTFLSMEMEEFWDTIKGGANLKFSRNWVPYGGTLVEDCCENTNS